MADRRVKYILEVDYEGESVLLRAKDDLRDVDKAARESGEGLEASASGFDKLQVGALAAVGGIAAAQAALGTVADAARFAYASLSEGAALLDAKGDFEDLAAGIGATADVLQNDLAAATAGLKTDAQLIAESSELMALNLGLTQEEIVRLSGAAAELDWDFGKLTDTLNTGSTRGLKEMGISIQEVKARTQELADAGMAADKAFTWAIIEAGEAKIDRVGKKSEEASGQIQILTVAVENAQDAFKEEFAERFAESLGNVAGGAQAAGDGLEYAARGAAALSASLLSGPTAVAAVLGMQLTIQDVNRELEKYGVATTEADIIEARQARTVEQVNALLNERSALLAELQGRAAYYAGQVAALNSAVEKQGELYYVATYQGETAMLATQAYGEAQEYAARQAEWMRDANERAAAADYARAGSVEALRVQMEVAAAASEAWAMYTEELSARGGDYFTQFSQGGEVTWDFAEALYATADAAGASLGILSEMAVQAGLIDQPTADAATAAAQQQAIMDSLAGAAAAGQIAWEDYAGAVQTAIDMLNTVPETPVVPVPDMADRGFRKEIEGIQEEIGTVEVPLEIQLQNEAIQTAVDEARGIVEGFTSPAEAYEAVMDLNITAVEAGALRATGLIEGIPTEKTVTIHFQATGQEILDELRALGAIP